MDVCTQEFYCFFSKLSKTCSLGEGVTQISWILVANTTVGYGLGEQQSWLCVFVPRNNVLGQSGPMADCFSHQEFAK